MKTDKTKDWPGSKMKKPNTLERQLDFIPTLMIVFLLDAPIKRDTNHRS